jgi:hypothetical protein
LSISQTDDNKEGQQNLAVAESIPLAWPGNGHRSKTRLLFADDVRQAATG